MKKIILSLVIVVSVLVLSLYIINVSKITKTIKLTTVKKAYSNISQIDENKELAIPIYINKEKTSLIKKENIISCFISDKNDNHIKLEIIDIIKTDESIEIDDENYHKYLFNFNIILNMNEIGEMILKDAFLNMEYSNQNIKIDIGSLSIYKISSKDESGLIGINLLKGIINEDSGKKDIFGIFIGIKNNSSDEVIIKNIEILNCNYKTSPLESKILDLIPSSSDDINMLLDYDYNRREIINGDFNIKIEKESNKNILIPLKKIGGDFTNKLAFKMKYLYKGNEKEMFFDEFTYYENKYINDKLDIIIYENN